MKYLLCGRGWLSLTNSVSFHNKVGVIKALDDYMIVGKRKVNQKLLEPRGELGLGELFCFP